MTQADIDRYDDAAHAIQSGVQVLLQNRLDAGTSPKMLRLGINMAVADVSALAVLLIERGIFTRDQLEAAMADAAEVEKAGYEAALSEALGKPVGLL